MNTIVNASVLADHSRDDSLHVGFDRDVKLDRLNRELGMGRDGTSFLGRLLSRLQVDVGHNDSPSTSFGKANGACLSDAVS